MQSSGMSKVPWMLYLWPDCHRGSWKLGGCVSIAGALLPESLPLDVQELKSKGDCCKGLITHGELDKVVPRSLVINSVKELQESGIPIVGGPTWPKSYLQA